MMTILFSGQANFGTNDFVVKKGEAELDIFVVTARNLDNDIVIMNIRVLLKL